jgi:transposase InsO family protein
VVCEPEPVKFAFILQVRDEQAGKPRRFRYPINFMCQTLEVSRTGFYSWIEREESRHARRDIELTRLIIAIDKVNKGRYGIDRIHGQLARQGERVSPKRVRRLARAAGLVCVHPGPYKATTIQDPANRRGLVDLVERNFVPEKKDQVWYGDITYIHTAEGWAYMATVIDGYSRKLIGWSIDDNMREDMVVQALDMAIRNRRPAQGEVVMHTDRGSQYIGSKFRSHCLDNGVIPSAGKTGICFDNAAAESFNATIKKELIHLHIWATIKQVKSAIFEYVESYYNRHRIQRELGYLSPYEYESGPEFSAALAA